MLQRLWHRLTLRLERPLEVTWTLSDDREGIDVGIVAGGRRLPLPTATWSPAQRRRLDRTALGDAEAIELLEELFRRGELLVRPRRRYGLSFARLYDLDESERALLQVPWSEPRIGLSIETLGRPSDLTMRFRVLVDLPGPGKTRFPDLYRSGFFIVEHSDGQATIVGVTPEVRELLEAVRDERAAALQSENDGYRWGVEVRDLARRAGAHVDKYLENFNALFIDKLTLDIEALAPDHLEVLARPNVPEGDGGPLVDEERLRRLARTPRPRKVTVGEPGQPRLCLSREQVDAIVEVRERVGTLQGPWVPAFLDDPEPFLPEGAAELFDKDELDAYSARVRGRVAPRYQARPYLAVRLEGGLLDVDAAVELRDADGEGAATLPLEDAAELLEGRDPDAPPYVFHEGVWVRVDQLESSHIKALVGVRQRLGGRRPSPEARHFLLDVCTNIRGLEYHSDTYRLDHLDWLQREAPLEERRPAEIFRGELEAFQRRGLWWMHELERQGLGGLLADEMGLGKTVQVIAFMADLLAEERLFPALIVVPATLLWNWHEELERFLPELSGLIVHHYGPYRAVEAKALAEDVVVLTTYETLRRDQLILARVDWKLVVCDEAQALKNPGAGRTLAVKALKARTRLALTGTPVENGLDDLWSIVDFVQPGHLDSLVSFRRAYRSALEADEASRQALRRQVGRLMLRRRKTDLLPDLPPLHQWSHEVELTDHQVRAYQEVLEEVRRDPAQIGDVLHRLVLLCAHPVAVDRTLPRGDDRSPKMDKVVEILDEVRRRGEKAIVWTDRRPLHVPLSGAVRRAFGLDEIPLIRGDVPVRRRHEMVADFELRRGFAVLIASPRCLGTGLNLTVANHVIHVTRPWNPATEDQATARAWRMGQRREVHVHRITARAPGGRFRTIDERIDELLAAKRELAAGVLAPPPGKISQDELAAALDLPPPSPRPRPSCTGAPRR